MMTAEEAAEAARGLTFEKVWAMFQETDKRIDKRSKNIEERLAETDRMIKELSRNIGGVNNSLGKWMEEMVSARLWEKFTAIGFEFTKGGPCEFLENKRILAQADVFLENGEYAMPVEVKTDLTEEDIDEHIERIGKIRHYMDVRGDKRKLVGAVAGAIAPENVRNYAFKKGLYVLVQSGDSIALAERPKTFNHREW
ncbi:MAG: hypothetical protein LBP76_08180 [Treponema sp.]|jgi:hypothetical protein|nr:hypothetical protein [Treponema sp.]